jgi:hypothetical protein
MHDLVLFSGADEHPLAHWLKPGFRHVTAVRFERDGYWTCYDWSPSGLHTAPIGGTLDSLIEFYEAAGATIQRRPVSLRRWNNWPLMLNNCVGLTKQILGIPALAVTPHQLSLYLQKEALT